MLSLLRDAESSLFVFRRKALGIFAQMEEFPVNPTFEATPSNKHKTTFRLYLKRFGFFSNVLLPDEKHKQLQVWGTFCQFCCSGNLQFSSECLACSLWMCKTQLELGVKNSVLK